MRFRITMSDGTIHIVNGMDYVEAKYKVLAVINSQEIAVQLPNIILVERYFDTWEELHNEEHCS